MTHLVYQKQMCNNHIIACYLFFDSLINISEKQRLGRIYMLPVDIYKFTYDQAIDVCHSKRYVRSSLLYHWQISDNLLANERNRATVTYIFYTKILPFLDEVFILSILKNN